MTNEHYNAADPKQVQKRTDKAKSRKEQQDKDLAELLAMPQFRRYIWRHLNETCGIIAKAEFVPNGSTENYRRGMQGVGAAIWSEIEQVDAKLIPQMMLEYLESQEAK